MLRHQILAGLMTLVLLATVVIVAYSIIEDSAAEPHQRAEVSPPPSPDEDDDDAEPADADDADEPAEAEEAAPHREPHPDAPAIVRVDLDGQDLADLLNIRAWKFRYALPQDQYTAHVWVERWTRDAEKPQARLLLNQTLTAHEGDILLRLPTNTEPAMFVRVGSAVARSAEADPIALPTPVRRDVLEQRDIAFNEPIHLVTFTHNASGPTTGGLEDVHRDHDVTVYVKARFYQGANIPFEYEDRE